MVNIVVLAPVAVVFVLAWLYPVAQAIRIPSAAWEEADQIKGLWVALAFWFPAFFGPIFLLAVRPHLVQAWRDIHARSFEA